MNYSYALAWVASILWAAQAVLIRGSARAGQPVEGFVMATIAASAVAVVAVATNGWPRMSADAATFAFTSELAGLMGLLLVFVALKDGRVGPVSAIVAVHPILASLVAYVWLGEALSVSQWVGVVVTVLGVMLVMGV